MTDRDTGQRLPDAFKQGQRLGIPLSALTRERLVDIIRIYDEVSGAHTLAYAESGEEEWWLHELIRSVEKCGSAEFKFGSRLTPHSKFWANHRRAMDGGRVVEFSFDDNNSYASAQRIAEGEAMGEEFRRRTNDYLFKSGIGIPLASRF